MRPSTHWVTFDMLCSWMWIIGLLYVSLLFCSCDRIYDTFIFVCLIPWSLFLWPYLRHVHPLFCNLVCPFWLCWCFCFLCSVQLFSTSPDDGSNCFRNVVKWMDACFCRWHAFYFTCQTPKSHDDSLAFPLRLFLSRTHSSTAGMYFPLAHSTHKILFIHIFASGCLPKPLLNLPEELSVGNHWQNIHKNIMIPRVDSFGRPQLVQHIAILAHQKVAPFPNAFACVLSASRDACDWSEQNVVCHVMNPKSQPVQTHRDPCLFGLLYVRPLTQLQHRCVEMYLQLVIDNYESYKAMNVTVNAVSSLQFDFVKSDFDWSIQ